MRSLELKNEQQIARPPPVQSILRLNYW